MASTKTIFIILTSQCVDNQWGMAGVAFSISSRKKAHDQMTIIRKSVEQGKWFTDDDHCEVIYDVKNPESNNCTQIREIMIQHSSGTRTLYRMIPSELDSLYAVR